jgi:IS5 family transposase
LWWPKKSCEDRESPLQTPLFSKEIIDLPDQTTILLHRRDLETERLGDLSERRDLSEGEIDFSE